MKTIKQYLPIIIFVILIFGFALQSPDTTTFLSDQVQSICRSIIPNATGKWVTNRHWFRSLFHIPLYFVFGIIVSICISDFWKSEGICSMVALADETIKIFLPTREFEFLDLLFDMIGFAIGITIILLFKFVKSRSMAAI